MGIWFLSRVVGGRLRPGSDAQDARFFTLQALPNLAFPTDELVCQKLRPLLEGGEFAAVPSEDQWVAELVRAWLADPTIDASAAR